MLEYLMELKHEGYASVNRKPSSYYPSVFVMRNFTPFNMIDFVAEYGTEEFTWSNNSDPVAGVKAQLSYVFREANGSHPFPFDQAALSLQETHLLSLQLPCPPIGILDLYAPIRSRLDVNLLWLLLGFEGAFRPLHIDIWRTSTWNLLLSGNKRWEIQSPDQNSKITFNQYPGQVLHLPGNWAHSVFYIEDSIAISGNYVDPHLSEPVAQQQYSEGLSNVANLTKRLSKIYFEDDI